jgi:hypothetical protein
MESLIADMRGLQVSKQIVMTDIKVTRPIKRRWKLAKKPQYSFQRKMEAKVDVAISAVRGHSKLNSVPDTKYHKHRVEDVPASVD